MGYHQEFGQQWARKDQNQRNEPRYEQKWKGSVKIDVPEFSGGLILDDVTDWLNHVERVFEYHDISNHKKVKILGTKLKGRALAWWEQIQTQRVRFGKKKIQDWSKIKTKLQEQFLPFNYLQKQFARRILQYQSLGKSFGSAKKPEQQPWQSKNAQPVASTHTSSNVVTKTSFLGKPNNSNLSCKHYKYGEESHKSIEYKKPALQAKNKTLITKTMEEESDAATGSNNPMQQLAVTF